MALVQPPKKKPQAKLRKSAEGRAEPCYLSNDGHIWTDYEPDVRLIEPRILASLNYNYFEFEMRDKGPALRRSFIVINHGDYPLAFQVQTTDKWSYYVDHKNGIIPPKQTIVNASLRMTNSVEIQVLRRPHSKYQDEERGEFWHRPHEDKLFVLLAPQFCQTFAPEAIFHNERCHEKLRIKLIYTGMEAEPKNKQLLVRGVPGSYTWKDGDFDRKNQ